MLGERYRMDILLFPFSKWKEGLEEQEDCSFVKKTGSKVKAGTESKVEYFTCNRGGDYKTKGAGKRRLKSQGKRVPM